MSERVPVRAKGLGLARKERIAGFVCISPWLIGMVVFFLMPMVYSFVLSFMRYSGLSAMQFVGLDNFRRMFSDRIFWISIRNTLVFALLFVVPSVTGSLLLAILLNQKLRGRVIFRSIFFLPSITPIVAVMFLWMWILQPRVGLMNHLLGLLGLDGPGWLNSTVWSKPALALISLWSATGGRSMIIFLAALQGVPDELVESAELDGAGAIRKFISITVPLVSPIILFNFLMSAIRALQVFEIAYIASAPQAQQSELGGPARSTLFYVLNLFVRTFQDFDLGYGSALAWVGTGALVYSIARYLDVKSIEEFAVKMRETIPKQSETMSPKVAAFRNWLEGKVGPLVVATRSKGEEKEEKKD